MSQQEFPPNATNDGQRNNDIKDAKDEKLEIDIEKEFSEAEKILAPFIQIVDTRYRVDSTISESPEQLKAFKEHNQEILKLCIERGMQKGLNRKELKELEIAAVLHDLTKADKPTPPYDQVPQYELLKHGEKGAVEAEQTLRTNPKSLEILKDLLGKEYNSADAYEAIQRIATAIRSHMGPHPGFMTGMLAGANKKLAELGLAKIEHPFPEKGDKVAETLLAADMHSLAGRKGREKVMAIRFAVPFFKDTDKKSCEEYAKYGVNLTQAEAALLSGFDSADQARDMIPNENDRAWINKTIEASMAGEYEYGSEGKDGYEKTNYASAIAKRKEYETAKQLTTAREQLG